MPQATAEDKAALVRSLRSLGITMAAMLVLLFWPAGTLAWPIGWAFTGAFLAVTAIALAVLWRVNPEIFSARSRIHAGTKTWDYPFLAAIMGGIAAVLPVAGLEHRLAGSALPAWLVALGYLLFLAGYAVQGWAQAVNRHFEPSVRIQKDRGQTVIDRGPYAVVRHPGYVSGAALALGMPLMLQSRWALVPALVAVVALALRTVFEERTLAAELAGYAAYRARVRSRWVPGLW